MSPPNERTAPGEGRSENHQTGADGPRQDTSRIAGALYGPLGDIVRTIAPHSEAGEPGLLFTAMAYAANAAGVSPHAYVDARTAHRLRLNVVLVGDTANGAKGDTKRAIGAVFEAADPTWATGCIQGGFASGEALIRSLADENNTDPRRLVVEEEFASVLVRAARDGSILSQIMRASWDGAPLENRRAAGNQVALAHHIGVYAHITPDEFRRRLNETEAANGFGNRFMAVEVTRSQLLPFGGNLPTSEWDRLERVARDAIRQARQIGEMGFHDDSRELWVDLIHHLYKRPRYGLFGSMTARWRPQLLRMAMLYAALDGSSLMLPEHLLAAYTAWEYVETSTANVFGRATGDKIADRILNAINADDGDGLAHHELRDIAGSRGFGAERIDQAISMLVKAGDVVKVREETGGRPRTVYRKRATERVIAHNAYFAYGSDGGLLLPDLPDEELI